MAELLFLGHDEHRKTLRKATVYCPFCRSRQSCKEKELAVYASFFLVPVKRITLLAKYYKCQSCKQRFPQYAPNWEELDERVAFEFLLLSCLIQTRMANGAFRRREATVVRQQFLIFAHTVVDEEAVLERSAYMKKVSKKGMEEDLIPMVIEKVNLEHREHILRAMTHAAMKEGAVNNKEAKILVQAGELLGVEENKVKAILPKGYKL